MLDSFFLFFCKKPGKETDSLQVAFLTIFFQDTLEERWEPRKNSDLTHLLCKIFCSALATIPIRKSQVLAVSAPLPLVQFNCATPSVWTLKVQINVNNHHQDLRAQLGNCQGFKPLKKYAKPLKNIFQRLLNKPNSSAIYARNAHSDGELWIRIMEKNKLHPHTNKKKNF